MDIILVASLTAVRPVSSVTGTIRRLLDLCHQHCATRRSPPPGRPSVTRDLAGVCHFSIKTASYRHRKTHCGDKTIVLYNGICPILIKWHLDVETDPRGTPGVVSISDKTSYHYQTSWSHEICGRSHEICGLNYRIALKFDRPSGDCDWISLFHVTTWCRQATSHYLSQCWPIFMSPFGVTGLRWVKLWPLNVEISDLCLTFN